MEVNPLVFETSASTDSAIWAFVEDAANIGAFLRSRKPEGAPKKNNGYAVVA